MRQLLDWSMKNIYAVSMATFYVGEGETLVAKMNAAGVDWTTLKPAVDDTLYYARAGRMLEAALVYGVMLRVCMDWFWPDCQHFVWQRAKILLKEAEQRQAQGLSLEGVVPEYDQAVGIRTLPTL